MRIKNRFFSIFIIFFFLGSYILLLYSYLSRQYETNSRTSIVSKPLPFKSAEKVSRIIDGDTFEIEGGIKVRMIGVDTPEMKNKNKIIDCFALEAKKKAESLLANQAVVLEKDISETDKFGRLLRYVYINGEMVNLILVREGFAKIATFPPDVKYSTIFLESEIQARKLNLGLWSACK